MMPRIFFGLALIGVALLVGQGVTGFLASSPEVMRFHFFGGVVTAIYLCALHTIVMFHFIGSGSELKDIARLLGGDTEIILKIRKMKMAVFPIATLTLFVTIASEVVGGGVHSGTVALWVHDLLVFWAVLLNLLTFVLMHRTLKENEAVIQETNARIKGLMTPGYIREISGANLQ